MISRLIADIESDSTTLTSALNQSKIIANKIKNEELKNWLQNELKGYPSDMTEELPSYRIFSVDIRGELVDSYGNIHGDALLVLDKLGKEWGTDKNPALAQEIVEKRIHC